MRRNFTIAMMLLAAAAGAQTILFTENFNTGGGSWTLNVPTGPEGADPNFFLVADNEGGGITPNLGAPGSCGVANNGDMTLHITSVFNPSGGAAYDAGGLCGILFCPQANRRSESPVINCSGQSTISVSFNYIEGGQTTLDDATFWYFDGTSWTMIDNMPKTLTGCGGQGLWTSRTVALPASANNNPNVKIAFGWINNDDGVGTDPSFAVDEVVVSAPSSGSPPTAAFTASSNNVCTGQPVNFTDGSTGSPTSWSWTFPSGSPATSTSQNVTGVTWSAAGTYTVTLNATNANGSNSTTQVITVTASPTVTATAANTVICQGQSVTLNTSGATSYNWMPGSLSGSSVSVTPASTTTYTVTGTSGSCTDTAQITITVQACAPPTAAFTASSSSVCAGQPVTFADNSTGGPTSWNWTFPGGTPPSSTSQNPGAITWASAGTYTVTLQVSNVNGSNSTTQVVTVNPLPNVTVSSSTVGNGVCQGGSLTLTAAGALSYTWLPGGQTTNPLTVTPASATTYTVTGIDANGCPDTAQIAVTIFPAPPVTATALNATICTGQSTILTAGGASTYLWMPGSQTGTSVTVTPATSTTYTVTGTDVNGCTGSTQVSVVVQPCSVPTALASVSDNSICEGTCISFTDNSSGTPTGWAWTFPGGSPSTSTQQNPSSVCFATAGTYTVQLIATNSSGSDTTTVVVTVGAPATIDAGADEQIAIGNSTTLTATGGTGTYVWTPPAGLSCTTCASPTASPTVTTTYTVTMTDANGCVSSDTVRVEVTEQYDLFVPSGFSPDGNGINDVLYVRGAGISSLQFTVFSRIGEKVFETTDKNVGWDGTFRGMPMNTGVFTYYVRADFYNGTSVSKKGDITLVR